MRRAASGRRRADVVVNPIDQFAVADVVANVVSGDDRDAVAFVDRNRGAVDARSIASTIELIGPRA